VKLKNHNFIILRLLSLTGAATKTCFQLEFPADFILIWPFRPVPDQLNGYAATLLYLKPVFITIPAKCNHLKSSR